MNRLSAIFLIPLLVAAAPASAQSPHGRSSSEPSKTGPRALFISPSGEPFRAAPADEYPSARWFAAADLNRDGGVDRAEFRADADRFFTVLDLNKDGVITGPEITHYERVLVPEILGMFRADRSVPRITLAQMGGGPPGGAGGMRGMHKGKPSGPGLQGAAPFTFLAEPQPVSASDGDFDRRIARAEFRAAADRRFRLLDKDGNGKLKLAELPKTKQQVMLSQGWGRWLKPPGV